MFYYEYKHYELVLFCEVGGRYRRGYSYGGFREEKSVVRCVLAGSKSVSDRLLILWQEYQNQHRSGLSLVQAASQLLASF